MSAPLDLAALHKERQARLAATKKRERSISPPAARKTPNIAESTVKLPSGARLTSISIESKKPRHKEDSAASTSTHGLSSEKTAASRRLTYPHGAMKKTWAFGHTRDGSDVKIEEVLEAQTLRTAVLSAFEWDMDWVLSKLKTPPSGRSTKCVLVMQGKEAALRNQMYEQTKHMRTWLRLCFPPMEGQTFCMHSKLMLLFHSDKLRIAIPSANLRSFDWGENGVMENSVFIIDLPRLASDASVQEETLTDFGKELLLFLNKQGLDADVRNGLLKFDFAATKDIAFVHSIGGIMTGEEAWHSGLTSLSRAIQRLNLKADNVGIDYAASSIGNLDDSYLKQLHAAARGEDMFEFTSGKKMDQSFFDQTSQPDRSIRNKIRIYFPTEETVQSSKAGATGTICLSREYYENMKFPRRCFRDYVSTRSGVLSHNKVMYVQSHDAQEGKKAWMYHGSANVSPSAWGRLVANKRNKTWHMNCRNWECGVVLPVLITDTNTDNTASNATANAPTDLKVFDDIFKAPFICPAPSYEGREPWYFKEHL